MKLHDAYFFDNDRTVIKAIYRDKDNNEIVRHIPAQESNKKYQAFMNDMETISGDTSAIDKLHERTMNYLRESQSDFEEKVITIAKERGLVHDVDNVNTDIYKIVAASLFRDFDEEKDKAKLFLYKLTLFEMDFVKDFKDRELKKELRKSKTLIDATKIACEIYQKSQIL